MKKLFAPTFAASLSLLAGCSTIYSQIRGDFETATTELNDYPVLVVAIDGEYQINNEPRIEAGKHTLLLRSKKPSVFRNATQKTLPFTVEPCTRYYLAARHATSLSEDWTLVVRKQEPIGGCDLDAAKKAAIS
ncbi:MAG: hypothetical protein JNN20_02260 [Betaproteobacteria bacterium]|nr:hypothetical protein [Betaproteobacteria bacterium]